MIDEAHCVSAWGHDFRPAYLELRHVIRELGSPPVLALTATAPPDRVDDILDTLGIPEARIVQEAIDRENLDFEVKRTVNLEEKQAQLLAILKHARGAGIIYAATVREVNELYEWLANQQIPAVRYHGKLALRERSRAQQCFMSGKCPLIVATNAFGLGVDKPDVRFVVHWNFPDSVESYYQEAGRAGRDGQSARCILFYRLEDKQVRSFFLGGKHPRADEVTRVLRVLKSQTGAGQPRTITQLTADTGLSERRVRVICSSLEAAHLLHRRRNGRQLTRAMTEEEVDGFVRSFEEHSQADHGRLEQIMRYGESARCRMQFFREYFGEVPGTPCGHCDNCLHPVAATEAATADTAADSSRAEPGEALSVGSHVRHTRFGRGQVTSIEDGQVLVTFARHGQRRVLAHYLRATAT